MNKSNTVHFFIYCLITYHTRQSASQSFISKSPNWIISLSLINNTVTAINQIKYQLFTYCINYIISVSFTKHFILFTMMYLPIPFFFGWNQRNSTQNKSKEEPEMYCMVIVKSSPHSPAYKESRQCVSKRGNYVHHLGSLSNTLIINHNPEHIHTQPIAGTIHLQRN